MIRQMLCGLGVVGLLSCGSAGYEPAGDAMAPPPDRFTRLVSEPEPADEEKADFAGLEDMPEAVGSGGGVAMARAAAAPPPAPATVAKATPEPDEPDEPGAARQWFPESFLWQPLVETDADGRATVDVRVPDQLTTWRVLALAHTRSGSQAGAVHTFDSTLPLYVDPVVPGWLYAGDVIELPVQVVNTTGEAVVARVAVEATGPLEGRGAADVRLSAGGSDVRRIRLAARGAGTARIRAELGEADAAVREIPVLPAGRPVVRSRGGSVASVAAFELPRLPAADPETEELVVLVHPGPLAVLQAEVERAGSGGSTPSEAGYAFALAHHLGTLATQSGAEVDPDAIRRLQVLGWQRVVRHGRAPDPGTAADLLTALRGVDGHALAEELRLRMVRTVAQGQRADGTWSRQDRGPLQQVLVQTAFAARALPADQEGPRLRAGGALERYAREVDDAYTAAVVLASGLVDGAVAERLRERLADAVLIAPDGQVHVSVPPGVVNPWGYRPSEAELLAWTVLAEADPSRRGELAGVLMARWDATWGFGAGPADVIALDAVAGALPALAREAEVVLSVDGVEVDRATLDPAQPRVPAVLRGAPGVVELQVTPEVPGLAWTATRRSYVPWTGEEALPGVDVEVEARGLEAGREGVVTLRLAAPSGTALTVEQGIPAGATVDRDALAALSVLTSSEVHPDRVTFSTRAVGAGEVLEVPIRVSPKLSGSFRTVPLVVRAGGQEAALRPLVWAVE